MFSGTHLIHLSFFLDWRVLIPETRLAGDSINNGMPIPATIAFKPPNSEYYWIVGAHDDRFLKMVKIQVTGANTYKWISSKYREDGTYEESCLTAFTTSCFDAGTYNVESAYPVLLVAKEGIKNK